MRKYLLTSVPATMVALFLVSACAEDGTDTETTPATAKTAAAVATDPTATDPTANDATANDATANEYAAKGDIMDQPVDFSSPENVKKTLQTIREQAGEKQANSVQGAMDYLIFYDLGINRDKNKLYKKLNGKTPNEILGITRR